MSDSKSNNQDAPHDAPAANGGRVSPLPQDQMLEMSDFLQSGWRVAVAFLAPSLLGIWLDKQLNTGDVITIMGVLIGFVAVKVVVYRFIKTKYVSEAA